MKDSMSEKNKFRNIFIPGKNTFLILLLIAITPFSFAANDDFKNCLIGKEEIGFKDYKPKEIYESFLTTYAKNHADDFKDFSNLQICRTPGNIWSASPNMDYCYKNKNDSEARKCFNNFKNLDPKFSATLNAFLSVKYPKIANKGGLPTSVSNCSDTNTAAKEERWISYQCYFEKNNITITNRVSVLYLMEPAVAYINGSEGSSEYESNYNLNQILRMSGSFEYRPSDDRCVQAAINSQMAVKTVPIFTDNFKKLTLQYPYESTLKEIHCFIEPKSDELILANGIKYRKSLLRGTEYDTTETLVARKQGTKPRNLASQTKSKQ